MPKHAHPLLSAAIVVAALIAALAAAPARADDNALLIQLQHDGSYRVWHSEGATNLPEEMLLELEASATAEGGEIMQTIRGPVQAFDTRDGVVIDIPGAVTDRKLLLDRELCGGLKIWHADGATHLTEEELTELVLTALPEGGKLVKIGATHAKGYTTKIGVIAAIWKPVARPSSGTKPGK